MQTRVLGSEVAPCDPSFAKACALLARAGVVRREVERRVERAFRAREAASRVGATFALSADTMRAGFDLHPLYRDSFCEEANHTAPPSQRLSFEMAAVASVAGYRDTSGNVPLDACVPIRTSAEPPATITGEQMYVLLYVDGVASLAQIAEETSFSLSDTSAIVLGLVTQGLLRFDDDAVVQSQRIPKTIA